jgi:hypothetical protein
MKSVTELLPLAIGIAVVGGITWWLLARNADLGRWLLAGLLFAHGWVHAMFAFPQPESGTTSVGIAWPFDMGRSWLISGLGLDAGLVRILGVALMVFVLASFLLSALSTVGVLVPAAWWAGLMIGATVGSTVMLALFFSPVLVLGFAVNLALALLVLGSVWSPAGGGSLGSG